MIRLNDHLAEIRETQRQYSKTNSPKRRRDLKKHLNLLWSEYRTAKRYLKEAEKGRNRPFPEG